jgi:hypothetical protein
MKNLARTSIATVSVAAAVACLTTLSGATAGPPAGAVVGGPTIPTLPRPEDFRDRVTNPYFPMLAGSRWLYRSVTADGVELISIKVLDGTKKIQGIAATVVHDRVTLGGKLIENTFDWCAQDRLGNVWYLGEDTTKYEPGKPPSHLGSWEAGVDGARAGLAMPAHTAIGESYRQEFKKGEAEDVGAVSDRSGRVHVKTGSYSHVIMTKDTTALEPSLVEYKFYAPGVGQILELGTSPELETVQLVKYVKPS